MKPDHIGATYELVGPPPAAQSDEALVLRVRVRNTGSAEWPNRGPHPVNLAYHWLDARGQMVDWEGVRAGLSRPLPAGAEDEIDLIAEPPPRAGDYQLALDMVEENRDWFSTLGVPTHNIPISVAPAAATAPRVCIVNGNCMVNDAVGNEVVNQLRFFQARGYRALVLVEHVDPRQPLTVRPYVACVAPEDLRQGTDRPQTRRAVAHFQSADLYVFHYSTYYPLIETIRLVSHGVVLFDYHGVTPPRLWQGHGVEDLIAGQRHVELVRYADYAITHSSFTRSELIASGWIAPERISVLPLCVPTEQFRPAARPPALLERYGLRDEQPVLLYVGRMAANKRIEDLVRALALVRAQRPDAVLLLVGDKQAQPYVPVVLQAQQIAAALGVADGVIFTGQVSDEELPDHYRLASVFVTASEHEGFCVPVVEAMACGVPVVGAHATALPETIGSGGLTFALGEVGELSRKVMEILGNRE